MTAEFDKELSKHAAAVARQLKGDENQRLSSKHELRFGTHGSLSVDLEKGTFYDHSEKWGGGVLAFIERETGRAVEGGHAVEWLRENGYYLPDDGPPAPAPKSTARLDRHGNWLPPAVPDNGELTKTYDYLRADGALAYQVCRYDWPDPASSKGHGKTFLQRRPKDGEPGRWEYKVRDKIVPVPYRLPELLADIQARRTIFVVEGEKKVDMLREIGVPATCNHGGAGKWPETLTDHFKGVDLIILPDNDDAGRSHGDLVGRKLEDVARRVRILDLPGLPPKGGVDDWLPAGGDADQLYDLVDQAARPFEAAPYASVFGAVTWGHLDDPGPAHEWLVKGVLTRAETSFLLGESQSGKSFMCIDLAMAICRGEDWFGRRVKRGGVIYQAGESAVGVRRKRLPAYRKFHDCGGDDLSFVLLQNPVDFFNSDDDVNAFIDECLHWKKVFRDPLELIVIDTFNKATPGANENDGKDMGMVLARCERVRRATGAHVMLVHHLNAGGTKARGHTSLFGNVENVITVRKVPDAKDGNQRQIREWVISKQKDGEDGTAEKFVLKSVAIGVDEDGDPITSCVVKDPAGSDNPAEQFPDGKAVAGFNAVLLRAIYSAIETRGVLAPLELGLSRGGLAVGREELWAVLKSVLDDDPTDIAEGETPEAASQRRAAARRQKVKRARDYLYQNKIIDTKDGWTWLTGRRVRGFEPAPGLGDAALSRSSGPKAAPEEAPPPADLPFDYEDFR